MIYPAGTASLSAKCEPESPADNAPSVPHCSLAPATAASLSHRSFPSLHRLPRRSRAPNGSPPAPFSATPAYLVPVRPHTPLFTLLQAEHATPAPLPRPRVDATASFLNAAGATPVLPDLGSWPNSEGSQPSPAGKASPSTVAWARSSPRAISPFLFRNNLRISLIMRFCFKNS
jgi:hypothetical protein